MIDMVERLRAVSAGMAKAWEGSGYSAPVSLLDEAANEIERLRRDRDGYRAAWQNACARGDEAVRLLAVDRAIEPVTDPHMLHEEWCPALYGRACGCRAIPMPSDSGDDGNG